CDLRSYKYTGADLKTQIQAKYLLDGPGIINFTVNDPVNVDGVGLVVIYSNPTLPENSIAVLDGGLATTGAQTIVGLSQPLDKTVPGFLATLALGIGFSYQSFSSN